MTAARQALWHEARRWSEMAGPLSPRLRRWAVRDDPALTLSNLSVPPAWATAPRVGRDRLARLTGAVLVSRAWRGAISGTVLGRAAAAVGEDALDALINLPEVVTPEVADPNAVAGDPVALDRLGADALLAASGLGGAARSRLGRLFPSGASDRVEMIDALTAQRSAEGVAMTVDAAQRAAP